MANAVEDNVLKSPVVAILLPETLSIYDVPLIVPELKLRELVPVGTVIVGNVIVVEDPVASGV